MLIPNIHSTFVPQTSRDGAVVARWAHNPKVIGSSPVPATKKKAVRSNRTAFFYYHLIFLIFNTYQNYFTYVCKDFFIRSKANADTYLNPERSDDLTYTGIG